MGNTDLLELIKQNNQQISDYLGNVSIEQFIEDVKSVVSKNADKGSIKSAIDKLQELL
jgi:hypothetical protein